MCAYISPALLVKYSASLLHVFGIPVEDQLLCVGLFLGIYSITLFYMSLL